MTHRFLCIQLHISGSLLFYYWTKRKSITNSSASFFFIRRQFFFHFYIRLLNISYFFDTSWTLSTWWLIHTTHICIYKFIIHENNTNKICKRFGGKRLVNRNRFSYQFAFVSICNRYQNSYSQEYQNINDQ